MKKWISAIILIALFIGPAQAQNDTPAGSNILKFNLSGLVVRNISFEYERMITKHNSITLSIHTLPYGSLPFQSSAQKLIDKAYVDLNLARISSTGANVSYRFYSHKKGTFHGFYLAPMVNYNSYKTALPIQYNNGKTGLFTGNINAVLGGIQLGTQLNITHRIYLDLWLIGPSYGLCSGNLSFSGTLNNNEQAILKAEIEDLKGSLPIYILGTPVINENGASIPVQGPWAGIRALGINVGFRF